MQRYFLEVAYKGTNYSGFQVQQNANTIQAEVEKALQVLGREQVLLTGSSRTDAGVHAVQNFFHFDTGIPVSDWKGVAGEKNLVYKLNALLPYDIAVRSLVAVAPEAHCRFDAMSREYRYYIYHQKNPFKTDTAFFFPYRLNPGKLHEAAAIIKEYTDFTSFSKRNTQVKNFICSVMESRWIITEDELVFQVRANRFLRGMVRAITATMLQVGRNTLSINDFRKIIEARDCTRASFAVPARGLFLTAVNYPAGII